MNGARIFHGTIADLRLGVDPLPEQSRLSMQHWPLLAGADFGLFEALKNMLRGKFCSSPLPS